MPVSISDGEVRDGLLAAILLRAAWLDILAILTEIQDGGTSSSRIDEDGDSRIIVQTNFSQKCFSDWLHEPRLSTLFESSNPCCSALTSAL